MTEENVKCFFKSMGCEIDHIETYVSLTTGKRIITVDVYRLCHTFYVYADIIDNLSHWLDEF